MPRLSLWAWMKPTTSPQARAARDLYFDLDDEIGIEVDTLRIETDASVRYRCAFRISELTREQVRRHDAGWDSEELDEDGKTHRETLLHRAWLAGLLADVEKAVAYPRLGRRNLIASINQRADEVLSAMAAEPDLCRRMAHLDDLYEAVVDQVGGQAAEMAARWPWPKPVTVEV